MECAVVIPVYKANLSGTEEISFRRCLEVLGKSHPVILATFPGLGLGAYKAIADELGAGFSTALFAPGNFRSVHAYNKLLLSTGFYSAFREYDYILIYQLDAYVFTDRLGDWCERGYDYVGAPLFTPSSSHDLSTAAVGNGGFSLRRVEAFERALSSRICPFVSRRSHPYVSSPKRVLYFLMLLFSGWANPVRGFLTRWVDEDRFFSFTLQGTPFEMRVPHAREALGFAFDLNAEACYAANGDHLPFGCHQWHNDPGFYGKFISPAQSRK